MIESPLRLPTDGYIILPISMSRSSNSQAAKVCYDILKECEKQCIDPATIDVIVLYTTSLYYNDQNETAWSAKKRLVTQMLSHKAALDRLIRQKKGLRLAVQYMTWEELVLAAPHYQNYYQKLQRRMKSDHDFNDLAVYSIGNREVNDASISFLIEETVMAHLVRQKQVPLPKRHVREDTFRLFVYPGPYIAIDFYQWKHRLLPQKAGVPFGGSFYNAAKKELYTFDKMPLPASGEWLRELKVKSTPHESAGK